MSLPISQQRILDRIEHGLRTHDSRLTSMFATFTRLTRLDEMPEVEQLKPGRRKASARTGRRGAQVRWIAFVPVALVAVLSAVVIGLVVFSTQNQCVPRTALSGHGSAPGHTRVCPARPSPFGPG